MRSGIFFGSVDAIDGIVERIKREWRRPNPLVLATGGLATLIGPHCRTVERIEPYLTLYGLDLAYRHLEEKDTGLRVSPVKRPSAARRRH
jgi:type III pantothenate kinase